MSFKAVVEDDARLVFAHHADQFFGFPLLPAVVVEGVVEPHDVEFAVLGDQLLHLSVHVFQVVVPVEFLLRILLVTSLRVVAHVGIVGVVPVDDRKVKANLQSFGPESIEEFPDQVASVEPGREFVIGQLAVEQTVAVMVFGGEYGIFHASGFGQAGPFLRIKLPGIKGIDILLVCFGGNALVRLYPFPTGGHSIRSEMDEHPESGFPPPLSSLHHLAVVF